MIKPKPIKFFEREAVVKAMEAVVSLVWFPLPSSPILHADKNWHYTTSFDYQSTTLERDSTEKNWSEN